MRTQDELTVLVFKDNLSSRTFRVPMRWISRLGASLIVGTLILLIASFLAAKYYRLSSKANPVRVLDLEQELSELRTAYKALETSSKESGASSAKTIVAAAPPVATPAPATPPPVAQAPATPMSPPPAATANSPLGRVALFSALPPDTVDLSAQFASLPITMSPPRASWRGKTLKVDFNLQYTKPDKGSQQGKIVILARGPETLLAYPEGVFGPAGGASLVLPEHGEYFSVSRFREVNAEFGPLRSTNAVQDVEILLFNKDGKLLAYQRVKPTAPPARRAETPSAPAAAEPATSATPPAGGGFIEPGVDR